jgi:tetratricopeptide (TPR) repeat protein
MDLAAPLSLTALVERASALLATDPVEAERLGRQALASAPADPRARLIVGSARRRRSDPSAALAILAPLAAAYPNAANTQYELGLTLAALGRSAEAVAALRRAVGLQRDMAKAWRALADQLFAMGEPEAAEQAYAEHSRAAVQDPALRPAADAIFQGRLEDASRLLRAYIRGRPGDTDALRMLAETFVRRELHAEAEVLLRRCLELEPDFEPARFGLAEALFRQQKGAAALVEIERLMAADPQHPAYRNLLAACLGLAGETLRAIAVYESLLEEFPRQAKIWLNYGHALRTVRRGQDAAEAYRRCIALQPGLGEAYWGLANLKLASFGEDETRAMEARLAQPGLDQEDRLHLHYALGKALEDRADYGAAFAHYAQGGRLKRTAIRYDPAETSAFVQESRRLFTRDFFAERLGSGSEVQDPIFVVGLPRSGSTLIEQILASHSEVEGATEMSELGHIVMGLARGGRSSTEALADLDADGLQRLGEDYLEATRIYRKSDRRLFIDKMPNNFFHVGLIQLILPRARIIDARRYPLGVGFSAFKQLFAQGHAFSYDLADVGRYYRDYLELMTHYDTVLPGRVHRVIYEDMVDDTEGEVRRLLDYCGLPFQEACLRFYENDRAVRTVSSEQVRRPIFRDGLDHWRRFEDHLAPLAEALGPALEDWRGQG